MDKDFDEDYRKNIGKLLFDGRKEKGMSRAELGKRVGLHESTIKRYEDGEIKNLNLDKLNEISIILGVDFLKIALWHRFGQEHDEGKLSKESRQISENPTGYAYNKLKELLTESAFLNGCSFGLENVSSEEIDNFAQEVFQYIQLQGSKLKK